MIDPVSNLCEFYNERSELVRVAEISTINLPIVYWMEQVECECVACVGSMPCYASVRVVRYRAKYLEFKIGRTWHTRIRFVFDGYDF